MNLEYFVDRRLSFVQYFYDNAVAVFHETKRQIESGEPPYVDKRDPESADEPAFLEEWVNAGSAANIVGAACLQLLHSTLQSFLDEYMKQIGCYDTTQLLKSMKVKGPFQKYRALFSDKFGIDWANSGADINLLEQVVFARNDFTHNLDLTSLEASQTPHHWKRHPDSAFTDPAWRELVPSTGAPLVVTRDKLADAINALGALCKYLDSERFSCAERLRESQSK